VSVRTQLLPILLLLGLALVLTWLLPAGAVAHTVFQSNLEQSPIASPTPLATVPRPPTLAVPTVVVPTRAAPSTPTSMPTPVPVPSPTPLPTPTEGVRGFLPPPTLTARGAFAGGALPGSVVVGVAPSVPGPVDDPEPTPRPQRSELAASIDGAVVIFAYGWLCGGIFLFLGAAAAFAWLIRAGVRRA